MAKWEYCLVLVSIFREGSGGPPQELLQLKLPNAHPAPASHTFGLLGLLNQLGDDGWELVGVESSVAYLKRPKASAG